MRYIFVAISLLLALQLPAQEFSFTYAEGDKYRLEIDVEEDVYINNEYSHHASILNLVRMNIHEISEKGAFHEAVFQTFTQSENFTGVYEWAKEYKSEFYRDPKGRFTIADHFFMPIVRDVPIFPDKELKVGDTWSFDAEEVHDFSVDFGIAEPYRFPIRVNYTYDGEAEFEGQMYPSFIIEYTVFHRPEPRYSSIGIYPIRINAYSKQRMYWNTEKGQPQAYREIFEFVFSLSDGQVIEFIGNSTARVLEIERLNRDDLIRDLEEMIDEGSVESTERGITLRLENIFFMPDSPQMRPGEEVKLEDIAEALSKIKGHDILVSGHTALDGNTEYRMNLSEARAKVVAEYLKNHGVDNVFFEGLGSSFPVAENNSEEGRKKNRRVEITILE